MLGTCKTCGERTRLASTGLCWDCVYRAESRPDYAAESRWQAREVDRVLDAHRRVWRKAKAARTQRG